MENIKLDNKNKKRFNDFLSHLMYQTNLPKDGIKNIFLSWLKYAVLSLKSDHSFEIPYIGTIHFKIVKDQKIPVKGSSQVVKKDAYYLHFTPDQELKSLCIEDCSEKMLDSLVQKIESHYLDILGK